MTGNYHLVIYFVHACTCNNWFLQQEARQQQETLYTTIQFPILQTKKIIWVDIKICCVGCIIVVFVCQWPICINNDRITEGIMFFGAQSTLR